MLVTAWFRRGYGSAVAVLAIAVVALPVAADESAFSKLVRGNERFGRALLESIHNNSPEQNVVVSPISVTVTLAAIRQSSARNELFAEIDKPFGWEKVGSLAIPARMLLAGFEPPKPPTAHATKVRMVGVPARVMKQLRNLYSPEESWITNTILFRSRDPISGRKLNPLSPGFIDSASRYFGMKFADTATRSPTSSDLRKADKTTTIIPAVSSENDLWIASNTHLRTAWRGNTFSLSTPFGADFRTSAGETRRCEMITSEKAAYAHAITDSFEAVALPCQTAYVILLLPSAGKNIHELERELVQSPDALDTILKPDFGQVTMPTFHIVAQNRLRPRLEEMGIRKVFCDLGDLIRIPKSHLTEVEQAIDFQADREGIRATAETVAGAVYGGMIGGEPFKMRIDRPFLFLVRDINSNILLFLGAVMDPSQNR